MESKRSRASNHIGNSLAEGEPVEKIEGWEPLERRNPPDGTVVNVTDTSRPPWPLIKEVDCVTAS
jgi:hypothetical protein